MQVVELAFSAGNSVSPASIKETKIVVAQEKYLRPELGGLYDAVLDGKYPDLLDNYLRPALAHYVRYAIIPDLSIRLSDKGVQTHFSEHASVATDAQRDELRRQDKEDADILLALAVRHIAANPDRYPEYTPQNTARLNTVN